MTEFSMHVERQAFRPGETIRGTVSWNAETHPEGFELRLFWHTEGKGDQDLKVVERIRYEDVSRQETRPFEITLPADPYSFSGKLISLIWALEFSDLHTDEAVLQEIVVSPTLAVVRF